MGQEARMLTVEELGEMRYSNALEEWPYFDTLVIDNLVGQAGFEKFAKAGYYASYANAGQPSEWPFFKLRNRANVGLAYCNLDVTDRFNVPFHVFGIGVSFTAPVTGGSGDPNQQLAGSYFVTELPKLVGFRLQVGQDEKMATHAGYLNSGQGLFGSYSQLDLSSSGAEIVSNSQASGRPNRWNIYPLKSPIQIPRNETVLADMKLTPDAKELLTAMAGPGTYTGLIGTYTQRARIRVTFYGIREVQLRNLQHY